MRKHCVALVAAGMTALASMGGAHAQDKSELGGAPATPRSGVRDFDFEFGTWRVHHRVKRASGEWVEYEGTCTTRGIMGGTGNVEEHTIDKPDGVTHGTALRAYDAKTGKWAIWWVDGRNPHGPLDPPTVGHFENGVGTFHWQGVFDGKPMRTRFIWSHITSTSARWEQAYSWDAGKSWESNWIMEFQRVQPKE